MKRLLAIAVTALALLVPSTAVAHNEWGQYWLDQETKFDANAPLEGSSVRNALQNCWHQVTVNPGENLYLYTDQRTAVYPQTLNDNKVAPRYFGVAVFDNWHWHPGLTSYTDLGFALAKLEGWGQGNPGDWRWTTITIKKFWTLGPTDGYTHIYGLQVVNWGGWPVNVQRRC